MRNMARMVELVEIAAEKGSASGKPSDAQKAMREAVCMIVSSVDSAYAELHPGAAARDRPTHHDREIMAERYGLYYGAKMADPREAVDVLVWLWCGMEETT